MSPQPLRADQVGRARIMRLDCSACGASGQIDLDTQAITTDTTNGCNHDWTC